MQPTIQGPSPVLLSSATKLSNPQVSNRETLKTLTEISHLYRGRALVISSAKDSWGALIDASSDTEIATSEDSVKNPVNEALAADEVAADYGMAEEGGYNLS